MDKDEKITIDGGRTETVAKDEKITIGGGRTETVAKDETITIGGGRTENVAKDEKITIGGGRTENVGEGRELTHRRRPHGERSARTKASVSGARTCVGKDDTLTVGKNLVDHAGDSITLTTGKASITMKKDGTIMIKGKDITIDGAGKINGKAGERHRDEGLEDPAELSGTGSRSKRESNDLPVP